MSKIESANIKKGSVSSSSSLRGSSLSTYYIIINGIKLKKLGESLWEIPGGEEMNVPGRVYISKKIIERISKTFI